jgi:hypothetical protein
MRSRCMSLLPRTTLHSDSEQLLVTTLKRELVTLQNRYSVTFKMKVGQCATTFPSFLMWAVLDCT